MAITLRKAHPASFAGSAKTGANGRADAAKWDIVEDGRAVARLSRGSVGWEILDPETFARIPGMGAAQRNRAGAFARFVERRAVR